MSETPEEYLKRMEGKAKDLPKYRGKFVRDRSRGNCGYYLIKGTYGRYFLDAICLASVTNSDSTTSVQIYNRGLRTVINSTGLTIVDKSEMDSDIMETLDRCREAWEGVIP